MEKRVQRPWLRILIYGMGLGGNLKGPMRLNCELLQIVHTVQKRALVGNDEI